jgi:hypothetical protein
MLPSRNKYGPLLKENPIGYGVWKIIEEKKQGFEENIFRYVEEHFRPRERLGRARERKGGVSPREGKGFHFPIFRFIK